MGTSRFYTPTQDDIGYTLKFEIAVIDRTRPPHLAEVQRAAPVYTQHVRPSPQPPTRHMVQMQPPTSLPGPRFTILTYNLLADLYAKQMQVRPSIQLRAPRCSHAKQLMYSCLFLLQSDYANMPQAAPSWCLSWNYRKRNLLRELLNYNADILCLQEVQSNHYTEFWAPELQKAGYVAIYKKKTSEMCVGGNMYAIDGCATFFRRDRFQLVKKYEVRVGWRHCGCV